MTLLTRENLYDQEIIQQINDGEYFPDKIPYLALRRVVDLGAHIGGFSSYVKRLAPLCYIWAVEMDVDNYWLLQQNMRPYNDVFCYHKICGYEKVWDGYLRNKTNYGNTGLIVQSEWQTIPDTHELITVLPERIALETLTAGHESFDLLKIDTEGSEFDILRHAKKKTLAKFRYITGEYHTSGGDFEALIKPLLKDFEVLHMDNVPDWGKFLLRNIHA